MATTARARTPLVRLAGLAGLAGLGAAVLLTACERGTARQATDGAARDTVLLDAPATLAPLAFAEQYRGAGDVAAAAWRAHRIPATAGVVGVRIASSAAGESRTATYYFTRAQLASGVPLTIDGPVATETTTARARTAP